MNDGNERQQYSLSNTSVKPAMLYDPEVINVYENQWSILGYIKSIITGIILIPIRAVLWLIFFVLYVFLLFFMIWFLPPKGSYIFSFFYAHILYYHIIYQMNLLEKCEDFYGVLLLGYLLVLSCSVWAITGFQ